MDVKKLFSINWVIVVLFMLLSVQGRAQNAAPTFEMISLDDQMRIENSTQTYQQSINLADSLLEQYRRCQFVLETSSEEIFSDGLGLISSLYEKGMTFKADDMYCQSKLKLIKKIYVANSFIDEYVQIDRLVIAAEEYYFNGMVDRAIELYERINMLYPDDEDFIKRLEELKNGK